MSEITMGEGKRSTSLIQRMCLSSKYFKQSRRESKPQGKELTTINKQQFSDSNDNTNRCFTNNNRMTKKRLERQNIRAPEVVCSDEDHSHSVDVCFYLIVL